MERQDREGKKIMGGPCFSGGGTLDECLLEGEMNSINKESLIQSEAIRVNEAISGLIYSDGSRIIETVYLGDETYLVYQRSKNNKSGRVARIRPFAGEQTYTFAYADVEREADNCVLISKLNDELMRQRV